MNFENSKYLFLLLFIPLYIVLKYTRFKVLHGTKFPFPSLEIVPIKKNHFAKFINILKEMLILATIASLVVALARPRGGSEITSENTLGVDIVLLVDISGSMEFVDNVPSNAKRINYLGQEIFLNEDNVLLSQSRLEIAKRVMQTYIDQQQFNRIGLVFFSSYALTKSPLTTDVNLLKQIIRDAEYFDERATAIGTGILTALNRLKNSQAKSKVIILLTDGKNNTGLVAPVTASRTARELGVKIYTIGFGRDDVVLSPINRERSQYAFTRSEDFDPQTLQEIADITGGKFFSATSEDTLQSVYNEIDSLEKSEIKIKRRVLYEEKFKFWIYTAVVLFGMWLILNTIFLKIP